MSDNKIKLVPWFMWRSKMLTNKIIFGNIIEKEHLVNRL